MPVLVPPPRGALEAASGGFFFSPGLTLFAWPITFLQLTCISRFFKQTAPENYFSPNMLFSFMTQQLLSKYQVTSTPWYIPVDGYTGHRKPTFNGKVVIVYGKGGKAFYKTNGKKPMRPLENAKTSSEKKIQRRLEQLVKESLT